MAAIVCTAVTVHAAALQIEISDTDLPIDITAIGRQGVIDGPITTRFGAHLFTADAQRINEALAEQVRRRQESAIYLFSAVSFAFSSTVRT